MLYLHTVQHACACEALAHVGWYIAVRCCAFKICLTLDALQLLYDTSIHTRSLPCTPHCRIHSYLVTGCNLMCLQDISVEDIVKAMDLAKAREKPLPDKPLPGLPRNKKPLPRPPRGTPTLGGSECPH
jgi:hypothetical protein